MYTHVGIEACMHYRQVTQPFEQQMHDAHVYKISLLSEKDIQELAKKFFASSL